MKEPSQHAHVRLTLTEYRVVVGQTMMCQCCKCCIRQHIERSWIAVVDGTFGQLHIYFLIMLLGQHCAIPIQNI